MGESVSRLEKIIRGVRSKLKVLNDREEEVLRPRRELMTAGTVRTARRTVRASGGTVLAAVGIVRAAAGGVRAAVESVRVAGWSMRSGTGILRAAIESVPSAAPE